MGSKNKSVPTLANPASPAPVVAPAAKKDEKTPKMARKQAELFLAKGVFTQEQFDDMVKKELVTSGEGGGLSIETQMKDAGADPADIKLLDDVMERINKAIKGKKDAEGREIVGVAAWVKHKAEKKAAEATPAETK